MNMICWFRGHKWIPELREWRTRYVILPYRECKRCGHTEVLL